MVVSAFLNYMGGFATFTQVLFALPMTLDLLGVSRRIITTGEELRLIIRSTFVPAAIAAVYTPSLRLLYPPTIPQKYTPRTAHIDPLLLIPLHLLPSGLHHTILLPQPAQTDDSFVLPAQSSVGRRIAIHLRLDITLGIAVIHSVGRDQYVAGSPGSWKSWKRLGR